MKRLQMKKGDKWKWVFCNNVSRGCVGLCEDENKHKALHGQHNLEWFANHFGNHTFRLAETLEE